MRRPQSGWDWFVVGFLGFLVLALMFKGHVFGQGDPRPAIQTVPIGSVDTSGNFVLPGDLANHAIRVNVVAGGGSVNINTTNFGSAFPAAGLPVGFSDGTNFVTVYSRNQTPGATDYGLVVRPLMPTNGTQTMPTGDSTARPIYVSVTNGSTVTTDNSVLPLGATTVAQTNSVNYGGVVLNPSTMTLGNNATGMRQTFTQAGAAMVQQGSPIGDWISGAASATTTANTQVIAAQVAGVRFCMVSAYLGNLSSTDTYAIFRNGQTDLTGYFPVPNLGGNNLKFDPPLCTASATALNVKFHIPVSTGTVTVSGYKTKEF